MSSAQDLETKLNNFITKQTPPLPDTVKKALVRYLPGLDLIVGIITLLAAYDLWHWAHQVNSLLNYANSLSRIYGGPIVADNHLSLTVWVSLVALVAEALLYLAAFPATQARQKRGWDLMYYALLLNIVYGALDAFTGYGNSGSLLGSVLASAIGLYFLFQIRSYYLGQQATHPAKPKKASAVAKS